MLNTIEKFLKRLNYNFKDIFLLKQAFTHTSYASERKLSYNNQRLEFLGDTVIQIIVTEYLYNTFPCKAEGELTILRSGIVQRSSLADLARKIGIQDFLLLGKGEKDQHGNERDSNLCDAFEALIGAIFLDSGLSQARNIFLEIAKCSLDNLEISMEDRNPKGALQEHLQKSGTSKPEYVLREVTGKEHDPLFKVDLMIEGNIVSSGEGRNLKQAEGKAAQLALRKIKERPLN
ncbi:MAG TPA: ribonuclease III [Lentisphaeria bacterium]|nr:MAG: ribonuclease III [Lentisphaerae bacterium GWF2_38_69]HBM15175.1 ribonuclease III [Lentisphaeria bacterium]